MNPDPLASTPFRALGTLGEGAMGIVYEAEHRVLRTRAVVKVLRTECMADPAAAADRLRLEAQAAASLQDSPHIVHVSDFGHTADGNPYLVMERLQGRDLRREVEERGPLPVAEAVALARQILAGLAAAHAIGIVHRDIKPANLFLCTLPDGGRVLKILDFGIAKVLDTADVRRAPSPLVKPTVEGVTLGTPQYLSPEQALGRPVDCRSDIYAVGAVLYWLLTGRAPFRHHRGAFAVMGAHITEQPAPPSVYARQPIPAALERAVMKALAKLPSDRFQKADAFSAALANAVEAQAAPGRWPRTERIDTRMFRVQRDEPPGGREAEPRRDSTAETLPLPAAKAVNGATAGALDEGQRDSAAATLPVRPKQHPHASEAPRATRAPEERSPWTRRRLPLAAVLISAFVLAIVLTLLARSLSGV